MSIERRLRGLEKANRLTLGETPVEREKRRKEIREQAEHANYCGWGEEFGRWPLFEIDAAGDVFCTHDGRPVTDSFQITAELFYWMEVGWVLPDSSTTRRSRLSTRYRVS
jgi:hypothetical protein